MERLRGGEEEEGIRANKGTGEEGEAKERE